MCMALAQSIWIKTEYLCRCVHVACLAKCGELRMSEFWLFRLYFGSRVIQMNCCDGVMAVLYWANMIDIRKYFNYLHMFVVCAIAIRARFGWIIRTHRYLSWWMSVQRTCVWAVNDVIFLCHFRRLHLMNFNAAWILTDFVCNVSWCFRILAISEEKKTVEINLLTTHFRCIHSSNKENMLMPVIDLL